ncbi:hypothetical protein [Pseudofrankia sp. DC12]|uniref:hypothetical protein n=1 Tax=Pseudofrankia sp. DC12 TaxID=683315 RepID=UPI000A6A7D28|nr:hypothetical protein [Pseudofrankia sp. DC12]
MTPTVLPRGARATERRPAVRVPGIRKRLGLRLAGLLLAAVVVLLALPRTAWAAGATPITPPTPTTSGPPAATPQAQPGPSPTAPSDTAGDTPSTGSAPSGGSTPQTCASGDQSCTTPPATPSTPVTPSAPVPTTTPPAPTIPGDGGSGGVAGWLVDQITKAVDNFFRGLVIGGLNPLLDLLGRTLLTTPAPSDLPAIGQLWSTSWAITVAAYGLLIMAGGITVMAYGTTQTRTSIKEIAPRIPVGFLAAAFSQFLASKAIALANPLPAAILGQGVDPQSASTQLRTIVLGALSGGPDSAYRDIFSIFLGLFLAGAIVALLCVYIGRVVLTVVLIGIGPLALACHALPQTERIAFWWWRALFSVLGIQVAQAFVLIASFRLFFTPGGFTLLGPTPDGIVNLLAAITMVYFLFKLPFWLMPRIGQGRGVLGRIVRAYVMGRALGLLRGGFGTRRRPTVPRGRRRGRGGPGRGRGGRRRGPGGGPRNGPSDPYERIEVDPTGQGLIPMTRVPRVRRPGPARGVPRPPRPARTRARPGHRQLSIPFNSALGQGGRYLARDGGTWIDQHGQTLLPFDVEQLPPVPAPPGRRAPQPGAGSRRGAATRAPRPAPRRTRTAAPVPPVARFRQPMLPGMTTRPRPRPRPSQPERRPDPS